MAGENVELLHTLLCTNTPDGYERSSYASFLLTKAIGVGNKKIIETLFRNGAIMTYCIPFPPLKAIEDGKPDILQLLIKHGGNVHWTNGRGYSLLYTAINHACNPFSRNFRRIPRSDYLSTQEYKKKKECVMLLLEAGCDVNEKTPEDQSLLVKVIKSCLPERDLVGMLVKRGANINCCDRNGYTPMMHAVMSFNNEKGISTSELLTDLVLYGADIHATCKQGNTALHIAALHNNVNVMVWLMENGADIYALNKKKNTCLDEISFQTLLYFLPRFVGKGVYPSKVVYQCNNDRKYTFLTFHECGIPATVLSAAVVLGETQVALLLRDIGFMTGDDILWLTRRDVEDSLSPRVKQTFSSVVVCCPCPLSLISFVKISDLLGASPGREDRVKELGLPVPLQERLLFKRLQTTFDFSSPC